MHKRWSRTSTSQKNPFYGLPNKYAWCKISPLQLGGLEDFDEGIAGGGTAIGGDQFALIVFLMYSWSVDLILS